MNEEETILFITNGDGTITCEWCERRFPEDQAIPDDDLNPICPECYATVEEDSDEILA